MAVYVSYIIKLIAAINLVRILHLASLKSDKIVHLIF